MKKLLIIPLITIVFLLTGCGDSDSTTPTDHDQVFSLATFQSKIIGTWYVTQMTGSDTNGSTYSGTLSMAVREQIMLNGIYVTPRDVTSDVFIGFPLTSTRYTDINNNLISVVLQETGFTCTPVSPDTIPSSVMIGDYGTLSTMVCDGNTTTERSWRVEDGGNGTANLITNFSSKDQFNATMSDNATTYTINTSGDILALKMVLFSISSNITTTFQSI